jgi:hypothetical protein
MNKSEVVQQYIVKRIKESGIDVPTLEEINGFLAEWMQIENNCPSEHFEGYSSWDIQQILYNLFDKDCPIQMADFTNDDCVSVPLFRQTKMLLEYLEQEDTLKLTQTGNLPTRIVKEMYSVGAPDPHIESGFLNLRIEKDSISVQMARIAGELTKAIKKRNNSLSLTSIGKGLLKDDRKLLLELLTVMFTKFNPAYFDCYSSENIGVLGTGFNLVLLNKYGEKDQKDAFYSKKYFNAFPMLLEEPIVQGESSMYCYSHRTFNVLLYHLGLVSIEGTNKYSVNHVKLIHKTDLFDRLFKISPSND